MGQPLGVLVSPAANTVTDQRTPTLRAKCQDTEGSRPDSERRYICTICGYIYDPGQHLDGSSNPIPFGSLDPAWPCPGETAPGVPCTGVPADFILYLQKATIILEIALTSDFNRHLQQQAFYNREHDEEVTFTLPSELTNGTYFWRARVTNPDGSHDANPWAIVVHAPITLEKRALYYYWNTAKNYDLLLFTNKRAHYHYESVAKALPIWTKLRHLYQYENITDDPPFPTIVGLNREAAFAGDSVHLYGHGFGYKAESDPANADRFLRGYGGKVFLGTLECGIVEWGWQHIEAQLPTNARSGLLKVVLTTPDPPGERTSNEKGFEILQRPGGGIGLEFKVAYPSNPMLTQAILENAQARSFVPVLSDTGAGSFLITEHDAKATAQNLAHGNIIRCQYNGIDIFAWLIESKKPVYVDDLQQRMVEVSGRGTLCLLDDALIYPLGYPLQTSTERAWVGATGAGIMLELLAEAQARGCIPQVTVSFTAERDSNDVAWAQVETFKQHCGGSLLQLAQTLHARGAFDLEMDAEFVLHAYVKKGVDRTDEVVYEEGRGLLSHSDTENWRPIKNALLVEGDGELTTEVQNNVSQQQHGRREGYLMARNVGDPGVLSDYGNSALQNTLSAQYSKSIEIDEQPYAPFIAYKLGDTIKVRAKTSGPVELQKEESLRVMAVTVKEAAGIPVLSFALDLNTLLLEEQIKQRQRMDRMGSNSVDTALSSDMTGPAAPANHDHSGVHALVVHDHPEINKTTTKGDLLVRDEEGLQRLPLGANGRMLYADSSQPLGIKWAAAPAGGGGAAYPAYNPDAPPDSPHAMDDEFDGDTLALKWAWANQGAGTAAVGELESILRITGELNSQWRGLFQPVPVGAFTALAKIHFGGNFWADAYAGLLVLPAADGGVEALAIGKDGTTSPTRARAERWTNWATWGAERVNRSYGPTIIWARIDWNGTQLRYLISSDGVAWVALLDWFAPSITPGRIGLAVRGSNLPQYFELFRITT